jgi:hypothetical protein
MTLEPVGGLTLQATGDRPHLQVRANPAPQPNQVELFISLRGFGPGADPSVIITEPSSQAGYAPPLTYQPTSGTYEGQISFTAGKRGTGHVRAVGEVGESLVRLQAAYRLQRTNNSQGQTVYANDGNLSLYLEPDSLPGNETYVVVMPPGAIPGPLPKGLALLGDPYDITASGAVVHLTKPAVLTLRYDEALVNPALALEDLGLYRWDPANHRWQTVPQSSLNEADKTMVAPVSLLGTYALLAPPPASSSVFLPIIRKGE